jgi:hypothetical protein
LDVWLESRRWRLVAWVAAFLFPFLGRILLISGTPAVYSWDAFTRLWNPQAIAINYWLPLPQMPIYLLAQLGFDVPAIRIAYAAVGTGAATVLGLVVARLTSQVVGLLASLFTSLSPIFLVFTIVPYQEGFALLFIATALLGLLREQADDSRRSWWLPAIALAGGVLCRYEVWVFCVVLGVGFLARRQARNFKMLLPAALAAAIWMATDNLRPDGDPYRSNFSFLSAGEILVRALRSVPTVSEQLAKDVRWVGIPLALLGAVVCFRRKDILGREVLVFWLATVLLAIVRHVKWGSLTERMTVMPSSLTATFAAVGLGVLVERAPARWRTRHLASAGIAMAMVFAASGYRTAAKISRMFAPEAEACKLLLNLARSEIAESGVIVRGRPLPDNYIKVIFGHSTKLDPNDPRWLWRPDSAAYRNLQPRVALVFDSRVGRYRLTDPREGRCCKRQ